MSQKGRRVSSGSLLHPVSHPESQSGAPVCVTEHDNCLQMAMLSSGHKHLCLMHCSFQLLLLLNTAFNRGAQPRLGAGWNR